MGVTVGGWGPGISAKNCHRPRIATNYSSLELKILPLYIGIICGWTWTRRCWRNDDIKQNTVWRRLDIVRIAWRWTMLCKVQWFWHLYYHLWIIFISITNDLLFFFYCCKIYEWTEVKGGILHLQNKLSIFDRNTWGKRFSNNYIQ